MLVNTEKLSFMAVKDVNRKNKSSVYLQPQSPKSMNFTTILIVLMCCKHLQIHFTE